MTTPDLDGRVALVTGAARGLGRAIAVRLALAGASMVVNDRVATLLIDVVDEIREHTDAVLAVAGDVADREDVQAMAAAAVDGAGGVDILVNNAGVIYPTALVDISEKEWDLVVDVNLKGTFLCCQRFVPEMQARGWGRIVNLSSSAGKNVSTIGGAHYTAAKAGVLGLTRHLAKEVAADGVTVNAICPGLIDTDMVRTTIPQETVERYARSFPVPRLGRPSEVADLVAYLVSDQAGYITGASLDINGGDLMI